MKLTCISFALLTAASSLACLNDRDTLGYELNNRPDVQRALTGRFDRFPPQYYEMRVDRLRAQAKLTADEYDDLAVAFERLGRGKAALDAIAPKINLHNLTVRDRYRFYANRGTFYSHDWLRNGASAANLSELRKAETDIAMALKLNPNAHFGREGVQLEVLRWLLAVKSGKPNTPTLGDWLMDRMPEVELDKSLAGVIMLGGSWENPDLVLAIAQFEVFKHRNALRELALARYREILKGGKSPISASLAADALDEIEAVQGSVANHGEPTVAARYVTLRTESDAYRQAKTTFLLGRLHAGLHPDTNPDFWNGWKDPQMPVLPKQVPGPLGMSGESIFIIILAITAAGAIIVVLRRRRTRGG